VAETIERELKVSVASFGIEGSTNRNSDILIQSIPGCRLRGEIRADRAVIDRASGLSVIPANQSMFLGQIPPVPGMQLHVSPAKLSYTILDPLSTDLELCEKIKLALQRVSEIRGAGMKIKGVPTLTGKLDTHRFKTLVREMVWLVEANEGKVVKGTLPTMEAIEALPGNFLLNPGIRSFTTQPQFEKDWSEWVERLTRSGG
jgi:hypothetical protein